MITLLRDALERTLKEPGCARRWHSLLVVWRETPDPEARRAVVDTLRQLDEADAHADILRLTFLADVTRDIRFENAASAKVLAAQPADPDRLASFMSYRWLVALQTIERRAEFIADLSAGALPEMARRLMDSACGLIPPDFVPRAPGEIRRVAVVVPYVGHQFHTPSRMAIEQCALLAREGIEVHMFSAQELLPPDAAQFRGDGRELVLPPLDTQAWARLLPAGVRMTISDNRFSLPGRWQNLMPALAAFDPDIVLLVGLYSPLAAALHTLRPVVGISVNTVPPIAPLDVWLSADPELKLSAPWGESFLPPQALFHPYRIKRSDRQWKLARSEFGLSDTAVVWITAGFRLEREIRGEWASRMLHFMEHCPQVVWLVIGGEGKVPKALRQASQDRVRCLATRDDLPGILRICDIYVNPPRMGGGFSVAEAMAEGLPVATLNNSDGGDKVGELAQPDVDAYMAQLAELTNDPDLRRHMGLALRQRFDECLDIAVSGPALMAACRQAAALGRTRLTKPS